MKIIINKSDNRPARVTLVDVDFGYPGAAVFRGLNLSVRPAALTAVTGPNGSGKSTLLGLLAGTLRPTGGTVEITAANVAFAVQRSAVTDAFPITAAEAVMMGRWHRLGLVRRPSRADRAVVEQWLAELGLDDVRHHSLGDLSGGQRQRVLLAQAFAQQAPLLLLDEPTTGLDRAASALVTEHLRQFADSGTTVLAATHDAGLIRAAHHRITLAGGSPH
ncbi:ABC transporter [Mycobacterium sp. IS-1742]|uniref:zinc ABC transporter ATP-binding protein AztA n=1 Tax=Mycobacterium sp. IS-1742 TaxID=1772285 RepID=UPI0007400684|nr:zinc ABC transporter ATP-binding protein AztA [Mycobacterium sp. IS-1742]KUI33047.1 ABC transporter [Mycobacterium sp. IS-1742]